MIKRVLLAVVAFSALGASVAIAVFAAAFALFAVLADGLGEPGAAAVVAVVFALVAAATGLLIGMRAGPSSESGRDPSLGERALQFARDRPLIAAGGALAAGLLALRNPQAGAGLVSAFLAGRVADKSDRRRGR